MSDPYFDTLNAHAAIRERDEANELAKRAGRYLAAGDQASARNALFSGGALEDGYKGQTRIDTDRKVKAEAMEKFTQGVSRMLDDPSYANDPNGAERAWNDAAKYAPQLGLNPEALNQDRDSFLKNPKGWATFWNGKAQQELEFIKGSDGSYSAVPKTGDGRPVYQYQAPTPDRYEQFDAEKEIRRIPGRPSGYGTPGFNPNAPDPRYLEGDPTWNAMIQRESGGRPGVVGPETKYGRAEGMTQMLPQTAQEMAEKLGVPWRPELMRGTSPEAAEYQQTLGRAYYDEGLQKYGGDRRMAAMYYHGGPDQRLWGPKTRAYADAVAGRGASQPPQAPGAPELVRPAQAKRENAPSGYRWNGGNLEPIPGGPADPAVKTNAGLKQVPAKVQQGYVQNRANIGQIDRAIANLRANPGAMGLANVLGDEIRQRADPGGIRTRASVAEVGAVKIHDLSGAAVTAAETLRLKPFIPMPTDTAKAAIAKLEQLKEQIENNNSQIEVQYGEEGGYRPMGGAAPSAPAKASAPAAKAVSGLPPASALKADHITTFANGQRWTLRGGKPVRVQ